MDGGHESFLLSEIWLAHSPASLYDTPLGYMGKGKITSLLKKVIKKN
jgi:hypothetical protein